MAAAIGPGGTAEKTGLASLLIELPAREIGGQLPTWEELVELSELCRNQSIRLHLDGARVWQAAPAYGRSLFEIAALFDSVYVSFYKDVGALPGAMLLGSRDFIDEISRRGKFHGLAMRCAAISSCPGVLTRYQVVGGDQLAFSGQILERGDPVQIIPRSIVIGVTRQFARQGYRPIRPCEGILGIETYRQREGLGLPRFGKYRPLFVLRQAGERQRIRRAQDRAPKDRG